MFIENIYIWTLLETFGVFSNAIIFSSGSPYLNERLESSKAKAAVVTFLLARPTLGVILYFIGPLGNSNTNILSLTTATIVLLGCIAFNSSELRDEMTVGEANHENSFKGWEKIKPNFIFFFFLMFLCFFSNMLVSIELGNTLASVYDNILGVSIFEYFAVSLGGGIILRYPSDKLMKGFLIGGSLICGSYIFYEEGNRFFNLMIFVMKAGTDIMTVMNLSMISEYFPKYMMSKFMGLAMLLSRFPTLFAGYFVTFCRHSLGVHPFLLITFLYLFMLYYMKKIIPHKEFHDKGLDDDDYNDYVEMK